MKKLILIAVMLTGCVAPQMKEESRQAEANYMESLNNSSISCPEKPSCDKAFQLTKVYISNNSDMPVQQSDDTTISTYNPIEWSNVGMSATKTPGKGKTSVITIAVDCSGLDAEMNQDDFSRAFNPTCLRKVAKIYNGFKPFIESRLE